MTPTLTIRDKRWETFCYTIAERNAIYIKKTFLKESPPWTKDQVFKEFRFCNVFRDLDKIYVQLSEIPRDTNNPYYWATRLMLRWSSSSALIEESIRKHRIDPLLTGQGIVAYCNWATLEYRGPFVTGSFIVKRPGGKDGDRYMLKTYYEELVKMNIPSWKGKTIKECGSIMQKTLPWCGSFTSYCMLSDLMYEDGPLADAPDLYTYAEKGPGAIRGMAWLFCTSEADVRRNWDFGIRTILRKWRGSNDLIVQSIYDKVSKEGVYCREVFDNLHDPMALDVEHWLCELYKYVRGNAKRRYKYNG